MKTKLIWKNAWSKHGLQYIELAFREQLYFIQIPSPPKMILFNSYKNKGLPQINTPHKNAFDSVVEWLNIPSHKMRQYVHYKLEVNFGDQIKSCFFSWESWWRSMILHLWWTHSDPLRQMRSHCVITMSLLCNKSSVTPERETWLDFVILASPHRGKTKHQRHQQCSLLRGCRRAGRKSVGWGLFGLVMTHSIASVCRAVVCSVWHCGLGLTLAWGLEPSPFRPSFLARAWFLTEVTENNNHTHLSHAKQGLRRSKSSYLCAV